MPPSAQVIVVGSYNRDHAWRVARAPGAGETVRGDDFRSAHGGKGLNQAIACARQGAPTAFIGAIGADASGAAAQQLADAEDLDARWQVRDDRATGSACIVVEESGQNRIVVALGANEHLDPDFVRAQSAVFASARVLLAQLENNPDATCAAFEIAGRHGLLRVLNPAPMRADIDTALLAHCEVLVPNETEFALLLERCAGLQVDAATLAARDDRELHRLARGLGVATVVVTLGGQGCFVSHADPDRLADPQQHYRIGAEPAHAIDTTGAGDAFCGALAAARVRFGARPFCEAVAHANRAAALSTERAGAAEAMPRIEEVLRRFG